MNLKSSTEYKETVKIRNLKVEIEFSFFSNLPRVEEFNNYKTAVSFFTSNEGNGRHSKNLVIKDWGRKEK